MLLNPKGHYRARRTASLFPIFSQINSVHALSTYLKSILISYFYLCPVFTSDFPTKQLYASLFSPMRGTCPTHVIALDLITLIININIYTHLVRTEHRGTPHYAIFCILLVFLGRYTFLSTLFSNTVRLCSSLNMRDQVSQPH
jgi:hypothetical protein